MAGAPEGNTNAARGKRWRDAIEHVIERWPDKPDTENCLPVIKGFRIAAYEFVGRMMADKDIAFFREFGDRADGKPSQTIAGDSDNPITLINKVERVIVNAKD
jgi:hypothetical protein